MNDVDLYLESFVWKRISESMCVRYVVLKHIGSGQYAVQSADFFDRSGEGRLESFGRQFAELFMDSDPRDRSGTYDSIESAIAAHESKFSDEGP